LILRAGDIRRRAGRNGIEAPLVLAPDLRSIQSMWHCGDYLLIESRA
jgi:hypothetical protein